MKRVMFLTLMAVVGFAVATAAQSLTTVFNSNNGQDGNMFDIVASRPVEITGFDLNLSSGTWDVEVYAVTGGGTFVGSEQTASAWTLVTSATGVASQGSDTPTPLPAALNVPITAGGTQGFYITITGSGTGSGGILYRNGSNFGTPYASDSNIAIYEGTGNSYPFSDVFGGGSGVGGTSRIWNGTVHYTGTVVVGSSTPHFEDFESGVNGWSTDGTLWELGAPAQTLIDDADSGVNAWMTDLDDDYPNSQDTSVYSPFFDFSALDQDPVIQLAIAHEAQVNRAGMCIEIDLGDGNGYQLLGAGDWYDGPLLLHQGLSAWFGTRDWTPKSRRLVGAAGLSQVRLRFHFRSQISSGREGSAFDSVSIGVPEIVVAPGDTVVEDFEDEGQWSPQLGTTPAWECGLPGKLALNAAYSGDSAWVTGLDANWTDAADASIISPIYDFSALSTDPVLTLAYKYDAFANPSEGFRVEIDLDDGNGFQQLGDSWYDGNMSSTIGGRVWWRTVQDWQVVRNPMTGAAGQGRVQLRIRWASNGLTPGEGAAIDDLKIEAPLRPGTRFTQLDDADLALFRDGTEQDLDAGGLDIASGESVSLYASSPHGDLDGAGLFLIAEVFNTGGSFAPVLPEVWVTASSSSFLLAGGTQPPFGLPLVVTEDGFWMTLQHPSIGGLSLAVQALLSSPMAANGIYATSDSQELRFQ